MLRFGVIVVVVVWAVVTEEGVSQTMENLTNRRAFPRLNSSVSTNTKDIEDLKKMFNEKIRKLEETLESLTCPNITKESDLPENTHIDIENAVKGTQREIQCSDGYFQCGRSAVAACQDNNKWKILSSSLSDCVEQTKTFLKPGKPPTTKVLSCAMFSGTTISFTGIPTLYKTFTISLLDDEGNILLCSGYRFSHANDREKIVLNTKFGNWGSEQRSSVFPFEVAKKFTIIVTRTSTGYMGHAYGDLLYTFTQRSTADPTQVQFDGDVAMDGITAKYP